MTQPQRRPQTQPTTQPQTQPQTTVPENQNLEDIMNNCPGGMQSYTIQAGDTLWLISRRHSISVDEIMEANPGINPNRLFIGQVICIPQAGGSRNMPSQAQPQTQPMTQPQTQPMTQHKPSQ
uniref:LysM peptidoglycan-binding domain-containing protein n=1 Tax=Clostridium sp. NkU-1 TaxID=1095009 RepID=UPI0032600172